MNGAYKGQHVSTYHTKSPAYGYVAKVKVKVKALSAFHEAEICRTNLFSVLDRCTITQVMAFQAVLAPVMVLCGVMLYGFDAILATGEYPLVQFGQDSLCALWPRIVSVIPLFFSSILAFSREC